MVIQKTTRLTVQAKNGFLKSPRAQKGYSKKYGFTNNQMWFFVEAIIVFHDAAKLLK